MEGPQNVARGFNALCRKLFDQQDLSKLCKILQFLSLKVNFHHVGVSLNATTYLLGYL